MTFTFKFDYFFLFNVYRTVVGLFKIVQKKDKKETSFREMFHTFPDKLDWQKISGTENI